MIVVPGTTPENMTAVFFARDFIGTFNVAEETNLYLVPIMTVEVESGLHRTVAGHMHISGHWVQEYLHVRTILL